MSDLSSNACQSIGYTQVSVNDQLQQMSLNIHWVFSFFFPEPISPFNDCCIKYSLRYINVSDHRIFSFQFVNFCVFSPPIVDEIACRPSLLSPAISNGKALFGLVCLKENIFLSIEESTRIYIDSTIDVYLEYWDM